jgi:ABC-type phosphate transport system permease subunit
MVKEWKDGEEAILFVTLNDIDSTMDLVGVAEVARGAEASWAAFNKTHDTVRERWKRRRDLEKYDTGEINAKQEKARLAAREAELELQDAEEEYGRPSPQYDEARENLERAGQKYEEIQAEAAKAFAAIRSQIDAINRKNRRYLLLMQTSGEGTQPPKEQMLRLEDIVRCYPANQLTAGQKFNIYVSRWWEYLTDDPREANSEGGVYPAIFGTVVMTLLMALAVVPFGVLAALYLREYAKAGPVVSAVRIAVNNLAGVPSIVFGVFGLGFFCYGVGSFLDGGPSYVLPKLSWFVYLGITAVVGILAFFTFIGSRTKPGERVTKRKVAFRYAAGILWAVCALSLLILVSSTPFFDGFYRAKLPNPTFGKGALIWASMTLALMTLPVVIVATEEALSAVPNSMREGSYACGASKWQTIQRIVLPRAMPGIMTGTILAMARGAGEVAPLMLVGAVKMAPQLPFDWAPPFGINRSFMHLGFHIYDVGFQSQNSEAAKPMVFTTTLLLILIVAVLNIAAIWLRSRLRKKFLESAF